MKKAYTGTMVLPNTVRACSLSDMERAVFDILSNETIQQTGKKGPIFITKGNDGYDLYLGYDKGEFEPMFCFFSGSETERYPSSKRFMLSSKSHPFDQYVDQLKEEFGIQTPQQLEELISNALLNTEKIVQKTLEGLAATGSIFAELRNILLDKKIEEVCKKGVLLIKKGLDSGNLYLGHVVDRIGEKKLCFFESIQGYENTQERHPDGISLNSFGFVEDTFIKKFNIRTAEELRSLVSAALAPQTKKNIEKTQDLLDGVL